jgi:hypothetical protein
MNPGKPFAVGASLLAKFTENKQINVNHIASKLAPTECLVSWENPE